MYTCNLCNKEKDEKEIPYVESRLQCGNTDAMFYLIEPIKVCGDCLRIDKTIKILTLEDSKIDNVKIKEIKEK